MLSQALNKISPRLPETPWLRRMLPAVLMNHKVFLGFIILLIIYLNVIPIGMLVWGSFHAGPPGEAGPLTLAKYIEAFSGTALAIPALNTLIFALGGSTFALIIGTMFAWLIERTNIPLKTTIFVLFMTPHILPGVLKAFAWTQLLSPRSGMINAFFQSFLPIETGPFNIYSMGGMIWTFGVDSITLPFLMMVAAFRSMSPTLEEASRAAGAGTFTVMRTITMPILVPSLFATWILMFLHAAEDFEVPGLLGIPARITVFSTEIWLKTRMVPSDMNLASVFAVTYLIPALMILYAYSRVTRSNERFVTVTGKGFRPSVIPLGAMRWPTAIGSLLVLFVIVVLPFLAVLWSSLIPYYQVPSLKALKQVSLQGYTALFEYSDMFMGAFWNTLAASLSSTTLVVLLGAIVSWIVIRTTWPGRRLIDYMAFAPVAVSGTLFGLALLWFYLTVPIPFYETIWIIVVGFIAKYLPQAMRFNYASMTQVHSELEEASVASGASWATTFRKILVPLIMPGMAAAWIYIIALTFKVLSLPVMLSGANTKLVSVLIFDLAQEGRHQRLGALGVMLVIFLALLTLAAQMLSRRMGVQKVE
jgi:iron(III) transport system permease protein